MPDKTFKLIQRLNYYRLEHRLSQERLAKKLGVSFPTVSRWLTGKCTPNPIHEYQIKKLLNKNK